MSDQLAHITVDGRPIDVPAGTLAWEAAKKAGVDIPIFCYHSKMGPVGVCRMCLVEIEGQPKLTTACTTPVNDGMVIRSKTPDVEKAQRGVLEFLLLNHPLDCPICDRGGECPLQDQTFAYGPGVSRFIERKRHYLKPITLGPTIDLDRERCILCWRCVRYASEIVEDDQLILIDRGSETYIGTYEGVPYDSNYSGNVIELCPVGALTSRKQRFTFRPWDLAQHASICPHCPMGCNIFIDVRNAEEVIRFRSRTNDAVDDGWLCDRGRFGYDFIGGPARLKTPLVREDGRLTATSWTRAYRVIAENLLRIAGQKGPGAIAGIAFAGLPNEDLFVFRRFMRDVLGATHTDFWPRPDLPISQADEPVQAALGARLARIDQLDHARLIVVVATDPSEREPVIELRIRKAVNKLGAKLLEIGSRDIPLTEKADVSLRGNADQIAGLLRALTMRDVTPADFPQFGAGRALLESEGPVVVLYEDALYDVPKASRMDVMNALAGLVAAVGVNREVGLIPMLLSANEMAARDFGLAAGSEDGGRWGAPLAERIGGGEFAAAVIAGGNPLQSLTRAGAPGLDFCVVTALSENETTALADVVLPTAAFAERVGSFTNTSRMVQAFSAAVPAPGIARPDWQIFVELSQRFDTPLAYSSPDAILSDIPRLVPGYAELLPESYGSTGADAFLGPAGAAAPTPSASTIAAAGPS